MNKGGNFEIQQLEQENARLRQALSRVSQLP